MGFEVITTTVEGLEGRELSQFQRKTFRVYGVQITAANIRQIAEWSGGRYKTPDNGAPYVVVPCGTRGQTARGFIGDWVTRLSDGNNFRVYKNRVFKEAFELLPSETDRLTKVAHAILQVLPEQYSGGDPYSVAIETARKILHLV